MIHAERTGVDGAVLVLTIDRPERRNALNLAALTQLAEAISIAAGGDVRALVLRGAGGTFCAGADLSGRGPRESASEGGGDDFAVALRRVLDGLRELPVATMAAVEGAALGAGTQLAIACDLRVATPDARFGVPAARLGLMVNHWTVRRLLELAGAGPARAMLLAAATMTGEEALAQGMVQRSGGPDVALAWAEEIAALAPLTIAGHKLALEHLTPDPREVPEVSAAFDRAWASADLSEGLAAFAAKRPPRFEGR